jgi:1-acyl-sn-glycerol-3-phosphate acyltransferase
MPTLRAFVLAVAFVGLTLLGIPIQWLSIRLNLKLQRTYPHAYHGLLCRMFGLRVNLIGRPIEDRGVLMVANHTSYFDILVMSATAKVSFIAKKEVNSWPFFGLMARLQRSIYVDRKRRGDVGHARDLLRERLSNGEALVLFPEGTSTDGNRVLPFKSALMGAVETKLGTDADGNPLYAPVQPVSISYVAVHGIPLGRENRPLFAWYGDMDLLAHLWEAIKAGPLDVVVEFHPPLQVGPGRGRKQIAVEAHAVVRAGLLRALAGNWGGPESPAPAEKAAA